jgi:hypothetical protein
VRNEVQMNTPLCDLPVLQQFLELLEGGFAA